MSLVVLHVLEALYGGTSRHVIDLVRHTPDVEHHVAVPATRSTGLTDTAALGHIREAGGRLHLVGMHRAPWHPDNARSLVTLTGLVRQVRPDVVHGHSAIGGALSRLIPTRRPRVYTPNGFPQDALSLAVERRLGRRTAMLVAVSLSERDFTLERRIVPAERVMVIPNGVEPARPARPGRIRELLDLPPGARLVGSVGRLNDQKSPFDLLEMWRLAAPSLPDVHFVLVGDGPLQPGVDETLSRLPRATRIPRIEDVATTLSDLDVFVLLSRFEGGPYAALEAGAAGVPVLLTDVVGSRDVVDDGSGVLVPFGRPELAAAALVDLLDDDERRKHLAAGLRQRIGGEFDVGDQGARHAQLYRELAEGTGPVRP